MSDLQRTSLFELHQSLGAKMVPFAGYEMPVQYPLGVMKEHLHTRSAAGLFDVSHMGQVILRAKSGSVGDAALALETIVPMNILGLGEGRQRYAFFTNDQGGILDDLMVANKGDHLFLVVNAACKDADIAHMTASLSDTCDVIPVSGRSLLAVQGPASEAAVSQLMSAAADMKFMDVAELEWSGQTLWLSRSGYTGEDGFEISVPDDIAVDFAKALLDLEEVEAIGLGARDSLRLEAGLCLYGSDIDTQTSPVEASLTWAIQKARRAGGEREGGFPGADRILNEFSAGAKRRRVGLRPEGRAPMRGGTPLFVGDTQVGEVTSGGFGPSVEGPVAMGYVDSQYAETGVELTGEVRGKRHPVRVADLPFVAANFKR